MASTGGTGDNSLHDVECNNEGKYEISAAIDFGTTFSGVAYSYNSDQEKIYTISQWSDGTTSSKVPTAILFDSHQNFVAFGQDAINRYAEMEDEDEEKNHYFFHRFKMMLYSNKEINRDIEIKDTGGKSMKALKVFSEAISFLKNKLLNLIKEKYPTYDFPESRVQWVLSVPAIWNDAAKHFMRQAGEMARLDGRNLTIALEPECGSLYCLKTPKEKMIVGDAVCSNNSKFLVLDIGGGTLDITAHQIQSGGQVKEICKASGGALGGTKVDQSFLDFLYTLFTKTNVNEVMRDSPSEWQLFMQDFETSKKRITLESLEGSVTLTIPVEMDVDHFKSLSEIDKKGSTIKGQRLKVPKKLIADMISEVSLKICNYVNDLFCKQRNANFDFIVMVGGFSNSPIVVSNIKVLVAGESNIPVLVPEEAELAIMKGAVLFGWNPQFIQVRKTRKTYGFGRTVPFIEGVHPEDKACLNGFGEKRCRSYFKTLVTVGQDVGINEKMIFTYSSTKNSTKGRIRLYSSDNPQVTYTDEEGVEENGIVFIEMPIHSDGKRKIDIEVTFGDTEIHIKAYDQLSGSTSEGTFDFL